MKTTFITAFILILMGVAIVESSLLRADNTVPDTRDFYQEAWVDDSLKGFFLRRLANAALPTDPVFPHERETTHTASQPVGLYLHTEDINQIDDLFTTIAKRIQLRLVE